jgi:gluconate 2-dehydrogenase gamma chain
MDNPVKWIVSPPDATSRRDFLATSGSAAGAAWLARLAPLIAAAQACAADARRDGAPFTTFTDREGADFDAFAARILPTDDTPGAREAGCVGFADQALGTFMADLLPAMRGGLEGLAQRARAAGRPFAELDEDVQDEIVGAVEREDPGFFFVARSLVVIGLLSNPEHGGNRDGVGWELVGFENRFVYAPPFGFYDQGEHGSAGDAGA